MPGLRTVFAQCICFFRMSRRAACFLFCAVFPLVAELLTAPAMAQPRPRTVLIIAATTTNTARFREISTAFSAAMEAASTNSVYVYLESMAVSDFGGPRYVELLRNFLREKYRDIPIGAIVAFSPLDLSYAIQWRDEIWPGAPSHIYRRQRQVRRSIGLPSDVTGFTMRHRLQDMVDVARRLVPAAPAGRPGRRPPRLEKLLAILSGGSSRNSKALDGCRLDGTADSRRQARVASLPETCGNDLHRAVYGWGRCQLQSEFAPFQAHLRGRQPADRHRHRDIYRSWRRGRPCTRVRIRIGEDAARLAWRDSQWR